MDNPGSGTAPALRGGASSNTAPALRGGASRTKLRAAGEFAVRLGFTAGLLVLASRGLDWRALRFDAPSSHWAIAASALVLGSAAMVIIEAYRLREATRLRERAEPPLSVWIELFLRSRPWTFALPGGLAADGVLVVALSRRGLRPGQSVRLLLVNRLWGLAVWCAVLALYLGLRPFAAPIRVPAALCWAGAGAAAVAAIGIWWFDRREVGAHGVSQLLGHCTLGALAALGASVTVLGTHVCASALELPSSLLASGGFQSSLMLGMILPVSLNGLGLQEFLVFHGQFFAHGSLAALSLFTIVLHLQRTLPALAGLLLMWLGPRGAEAPVA